LVVDGVVGSEVSLIETTKVFAEFDAKEVAASGAEVMLLLCCDSDCGC